MRDHSVGSDQTFDLSHRQVIALRYKFIRHWQRCNTTERVWYQVTSMLLILEQLSWMMPAYCTFVYHPSTKNWRNVGFCSEAVFYWFESLWRVRDLPGVVRLEILMVWQGSRIASSEAKPDNKNILIQVPMNISNKDILIQVHGWSWCQSAKGS